MYFLFGIFYVLFFFAAAFFATLLGQQATAIAEVQKQIRMHACECVGVYA